MKYENFEFEKALKQDWIVTNGLEATAVQLFWV